MKKHTSIVDISCRVAFVAVMATMTASCSDDELDYVGSRDESICFDVSTADYWNDGSRSACRRLDAVSLSSSDGGRLYLLPVAMDGISVGKTSDSEEPASRGTMLDTDHIASVGVYAAINADSQGGGYMRNVEVTKNNLWSPTEEYLWPGSGSLHFNAYSPYSESVASEGITSLPDGDDRPLRLIYVTPAEVSEQQDLMWATPVDASASPCALKFNHALTAVRFVTGAQMTPCTVKEITISGVSGSGVLNIETGEWSEMSGSESYSVSPDVELTVVGTTGFAAENVALTDDDHTFMLLPQQLSDDAQITLAVEVDGATSTFTAPLSGQTWIAGKTVTYRLSANTQNGTDLILQVVDADGNPIDRLSAPYTGGSFKYTVKSYYTGGVGDNDTLPIQWKASFVDDNGNPLAVQPDWIADFVDGGMGDVECKVETDIPEPIFLQMNEHTNTLRSTADINTTSGQSRYNLSNSNGSSSVENTANCYVINAAGKYSLPLVYGNAVKNGAANEGAYVSTLTQSAANKRRALFHFVNHLGNEISSPYIYENVGCEPASAKLVWEDRLNMVKNVALSPDKRSIEFDIPLSTIRQGNAMVAVCDADGVIMWSWHLWITDYKFAEGWQVVSDGTSVYQMASRNVGQIFGGDRTEFRAAEAKVRFTQINVPDDVEPKTVNLTIAREDKIEDVATAYSFYQWGRKDPVMSGLNHFYDSNHMEIDATELPQHVVGADHKTMIMNSIKHPQEYITGTESDLKKISTLYANLWNIDQIITNPDAVMDENVKTIYDPNPVGGKVPEGNAFKLLVDFPQSYDASLQAMAFDLANGEKAYYMTFGYRTNMGKKIDTVQNTACWTAIARSATAARYLSINATRSSMELNSILYGFAMRPREDN